MQTKLFKTLAATAMSVLAIACAKEPVGDNGQQAGVSFMVEVPGASVTKAYGEAEKATELYYQVFDNAGAPIEGLGVQTTDLVGKAAKVSFQLVKDQTYNFVFWAQTTETGYYTIDENEGLKKITADYTTHKDANDENRDAFFATESFKVTGPVTKTVTLKRPFAQINIGTKDQLKAGDATAPAIDFGGAKSSVTVKGVPTVFSPLATTPETMLTVPETVTFASAAIPTGLLNVKGTDYNYLAMNYVFAPAEGTVCDLSAEVVLTGREPIQLSSPTTPIKRNWRTNILGSLLTSSVDFNVVVDPGFEGEEDIHPIIVDGVAYKTLDAAVAAVRVGVQTIIQLNQDMAGNGVKAQNGQDVIIDLGGHTFDVDGELVGSTGTETNGFQLLKGSKVTFRNGTIKSKKAKLLIQNYSDLTLENVTLDATGGVAQYVLSNNHGQVNVLGTSSILAPEGQHAFDVYYWPPAYKDGVSVYVNTTGTIRGAIEYAKSSDATEDAAEMYASLVIDNAVLENSSFKTSLSSPNMKVARSIFADETAAAAWIPAGYNLVTVGDYYIVTTTDVTPVVDQVGLNSAITGADVDTPVTIVTPAGSTMMLENGIANEGTKIRDITFLGDGSQTVDVVTQAINAEGGKLNYQRGSSFTFKNVTIQAGEGAFDGVVCDALTYDNCTIKGKLTLYGKATFVNCVFENTMADQYSIWTWGGTDVKFDGCTFNTNGKAILLYGQATEAKPTNLIVVNSIFNDRNNGSAGKAAIEIGNDYNATYKLTIDGCTVNGFADGKNTGSKLWANKNNMDAAHLSVTIDGTPVL